MSGVICFTVDSQKKNILFTYIGGRSLVGPRTGKGDKFMTTFMDHKTAHWMGEKKKCVNSGFQIQQHSSNKAMNQYVNYIASDIAQ